MKLIDLTGQRFGKLVVLEHIERKQSKGGSRWKCQCDCGNITETEAHRLKNGRTKSCGCLKKEYGARLGYGTTSFKNILSLYKIRAKERNRVFELTEEEFKILTKQNCHYCGTEPKNVTGKDKYYGEYIYNGIDRLNNDLGYTVENSVPCCSDCNYMKHQFTKDYFIAHIKKIYEHNK